MKNNKCFFKPFSPKNVVLVGLPPTSRSICYDSFHTALSQKLRLLESRGGLPYRFPFGYFSIPIYRSMHSMFIQGTARIQMQANTKTQKANYFSKAVNLKMQHIKKGPYLAVRASLILCYYLSNNDHQILGNGPELIRIHNHKNSVVIAFVLPFK